jgi:hypothetical protein
MTLEVGKTDNYGREVANVHLDAENVVIYETANKLVMSCDGDLKEKETQYSELIAILSKTNSASKDFTFPFSNFKGSVASDLTRGVTGNYQEAVSSLNTTLSRINKIKTLMARVAYWLTLIIPFSLVFGFFLYFEKGENYSQKITPTLIFALKCAVLGMLGGAISATIQIHNLDVDIEAPQRGIITLALSRLFLAASTGFASFYVLESGLFGILSSPKGASGYYAIAMIAGFSEHFVPNLLVQFAKDKTASSTKTS